MTTHPDQYDTPWKETVEHYFPEFMAFYFPQAHTQIDWDKGHTFLEQELAAITPEAEIGKRSVDKLVRVHRLSGEEDWIFIHLEVQSSEQAEFAKRMFVYNYRIFDKYDRPVASMAVLADDNPSWKPQQYGFEVLGCRVGIQFPVAKLTDYTGREQELEADPNPFALVTLAHLQTKATRQDPQARFEAKWRLIKILLSRGWQKERIVELLKVIDWMMYLPEHFKQQLWQNVRQLATEKHMAYVTSFEQIGIDKGMQAGMQAGEAIALQKLLTKRFGVIPAETVNQITTASSAQLDAWLDRVLDAPSLDVIFAPPRH